MPFKLDKITSLSLDIIAPKLFKVNSDKNSDESASDLPSKTIFKEFISRPSNNEYPLADIAKDLQGKANKSQQNRTKCKSSIAEITPSYNHSKIISLHQEEDLIVQIIAGLDSLKVIQQQSFKCVEMNSSAKNFKLQVDVALLIFDVKLDDYNKDLNNFNHSSNACEYSHHIAALSAKKEFVYDNLRSISIVLDKLNEIELKLYPPKINFLDYQKSIRNFYKLLDTIDQSFGTIDNQFLAYQYKNPVGIKALNNLAEHIKKSKSEFNSAFIKLNIAPTQPPSEKDFSQLANLELELTTFALEVEHKTKCLQTHLNCHILNQQHLIKAQFIDQIFGIANPLLKNAFSSISKNSNELFQQLHTLSLKNNLFSIPDLSMPSLSEDQIFDSDYLEQEEAQQKRLTSTLDCQFNFAQELIQLIKTYQRNLLNARVKYRLANDSEIQGTVEELLAHCNTRMSLNIGLTSNTRSAVWLSRVQDCLKYDFQLNTFDEQFKFNLLVLLSLDFIQNQKYQSQFLIELEGIAFKIHKDVKEFLDKNLEIEINNQNFIYDKIKYDLNVDIQPHIINYQKIRKLICKNYKEGLNRDANKELIRYIPILRDFNADKVVILKNIDQQINTIHIENSTLKKRIELYFKYANQIIKDIDSFYTSEHLHKTTKEFLKEVRENFINYKCKLDEIRQNLQLNFPCAQYSSITEYSQYLRANNEILFQLNTSLYNEIHNKLTNFKPHPNLEKILHWLDTLVFKFLTLIVRNEPTRQTPGLFSKSINKNFKLLREALNEQIEKLHQPATPPAA